ncbi:MAG: ABC-F family ATP-binding cassette domain-containing protein [Candidatus Cloacimonadia bacterium]
MNVLSVETISKKFGERVILDQVTFGLHYGEKVGLIGDNGCGKSTLLKIIADFEVVDSGRVATQRGLRVGYLPQEFDIDPNHTLFDHIYLSDDPDFMLLHKYFQVSTALSFNYTDQLLKEQQKLTEQIERKELWSLEQKAHAILNKLGFDDYNTKVSTLSGGQKRRLELARVLATTPDLLLLDEPTNHLDTDTIEWLQEYLIKYVGTIIFITHDRYFLDTVSTRIAEIEEGNIRFYTGTYSDYLQAKELQYNEMQKKEESRLAILRKELKWLSRGAKARTSKPKDHVDRVMELLDKSYLTEDKQIIMSFPVHRMGKSILEVQEVSKSYEHLLFENFSHHFQKNERIGIIGKNGTGKTTLLKIMTEQLKPDSGNVKKGLNTHFSFFQQEQQEIDENISVADFIKENAELIKTETGKLLSVKDILNRFNFPPKEQQRKIHTLSGGERKRLFLLKSLMFGANFIILDEPTNDFDIKTLEILEDYLDSFQGCLLVVSHDRYFLDRTVDFIFIFDGHKIRKFAGNYSDYLLVGKYLEEEPVDLPEKEAKEQKIKQYKENKQKNRKTSYKIVREIDETEKRLSQLDERLSQLDQELTEKSKSLTVDEFQKISEEQSEIHMEYEELFERWQTLLNETND